MPTNTSVVDYHSMEYLVKNLTWYVEDGQAFLESYEAVLDYKDDPVLSDWVRESVVEKAIMDIQEGLDECR